MYLQLNSYLQTEYSSNSTTLNASKSSVIKYSNEYLISRNITHFSEIKCDFYGGTDVQQRRRVRISVVQGTFSLPCILWSYDVATQGHAKPDYPRVTCHPAEVTFPPLPQPKLVLGGMQG